MVQASTSYKNAVVIGAPARSRSRHGLMKRGMNVTSCICSTLMERQLDQVAADCAQVASKSAAGVQMPRADGSYPGEDA